MTSDPDYPRMLFHRAAPPVTVHSESEEKALGPGWSRTVPAPEPGESPPDEDEPDEEEPEEEEPGEQERKPVRPPVRKPVRPAARKHR